MKWKARYRSAYRKQDDPTVRFTYVIKGTAEQIKAYHDAQGDNLRLDDNTGEPLYFTKKYVADDITVVLTKDGKVVTDDSDIAKLQSLIEQYGIDVARLIMAKSTPSAPPTE